MGTSIISAALGVVLGLSYMKRPYNLTKVLNYSRISIRFLARVIIMIIIGLVPIVIFLNPLWHRIHTDPDGKALIEWVCANLAFFLAIFMILMLSPIIGEKLGLEGFKHPRTYAEFKQF